MLISIPSLNDLWASMFPSGNDLHRCVWDFVGRPLNKLLRCHKVFDGHKAERSEILLLRMATDGSDDLDAEPQELWAITT